MDASELIRRRQARTVYRGMVEQQQYNEAQNINRGVGLNVGTKMSGGMKYPEWVYLVQQGNVLTARDELPTTTVIQSQSVPTVPVITAPSEPTITSTTGANTVLTVVFDEPTSDGGSAIIDYEYSTDNGITFVSAGGISSPLTFAGLINGITYQVVIRAVNSAGSGTNSAAVSGTPVTIPLAPTITGITPGDSRLTVIFTAPTDNGGSAITDYEASINNGVSYVSVGTSNPIQIIGLSNGTTYQVVLRAKNTVPGSGVASNMASGTPATTPSAPTITGITAGNTTVDVAFTIPSSTGGAAITGYEISTNNGSTFTSIGMPSNPVRVTGLTNGTTYQVVLRAVNSRGSGAASSAMTGSPVAPAAPQSAFVWGVNMILLTPIDIIVDSNNNVYVIGYPNTNTSLTPVYNYSQTSNDTVEYSLYGNMPVIPFSTVYIIKYNSVGQVQWINLIQHQISSGSNNNNQTFRLTVDSQNNIYCTFSTGGSGTNPRIIEIKQSSGIDGSNTILYETRGAFTSSAALDAFVLKVDTDGNNLWISKINNGTNATDEQLYNIATDSASNVYVVGHFGGAGSISTNTVMFYNGAILSGSSVQSGFTDYGQLQAPSTRLAGFICKYDSTGQIQWVHMLLNSNISSGFKYYNARCSAIAIDSADNVIAVGGLQSSMAPPLTSPTEFLSYSATSIPYSPSLYVFHSIIPGTPNKIQVKLFGQIQSIPQGSSGTMVLMKFQPSGDCIWINAGFSSFMDNTWGSRLTIDTTTNDIYTIGTQGATSLQLYTCNGVQTTQDKTINLVPSYTVDTVTNNSGTIISSNNIYRFNSSGTVISVGKIYKSSIQQITLNYILNTGLVIGGMFGPTVDTGMCITNFTSVNSSTSSFQPTSLYGIMPLQKDIDIFIVKYNTNLQGEKAVNINTGTVGTTLQDQIYSLYVRNNYLYMVGRFSAGITGGANLKLQTYTGIDSNSNILQTGDIIMPYIPSSQGDGFVIKYDI